MLHTLQERLAPVVLERLVLLVNHVLAREPQAMERLKPHVGRVLRLDLPRPPAWLGGAGPELVFRVTPAGLFEWAPEATAADLRARPRAMNPVDLAGHLLRGESPPLDIEGDSRFAADVDWLARNLRWDVADDLHRLFGPTVAAPIGQLGSALASALREAARLAAQFADRARPR